MKDMQSVAIVYTVISGSGSGSGSDSDSDSSM